MDMEIDAVQHAAAPAQNAAREQMHAQLIARTIDTMHSGMRPGQSAGYQFQKDVLSAAMGIGTNINISV